MRFCEPGTILVAPFARVKSVIAHIEFSTTATCGFLIGGDTLLTARVDAIADCSARVERNGLESVKLETGSGYDDATRYPNVGILQFAADHSAIVDNGVRIGQERNIVDLLAQIVARLGYCWAVNGSANPLLHGHGIPSATLVERAHGLAAIDLSPGLPSASSCPEAIWQAARWWYEAYEPIEGLESIEGTQTTMPASFIPRGAYIIRQPAAAAVGIRDDFDRAQIGQTDRDDPLFAALRSRRGGDDDAAKGDSSRRGAKKK